MFCSMVSGYIGNLANHLSMVSQTELDESAEINLHDYKNYMPSWSKLVSLCFDLEKSKWILFDKLQADQISQTSSNIWSVISKF